MLTIAKLKVKSFDLDYNDLQWEIEDTEYSPYDFTFRVERAEGPMGPWDPVSDEFSDRYLYRDSLINRGYRYRQYWYRIRITRKSDSETTYSSSATMGAEADLIAQEVRRVERVLFEEFVGRKCYLFPVRTFGQRCTSCFDIVSGQRLRSQCVDCYDTTYTMGYHNPIEVWLQFDPGGKHVETNIPYMETTQGNTVARMVDFPPCKPRDIIVEAGENNRWRVERVSTTQRLRAILHQELTMHSVPMSDVEFKLPINVDDAMSLIVSPPRNFENPQQLGETSDFDYFTDVMKVWGYNG